MRHTVVRLVCLCAVLAGCSLPSVAQQKWFLLSSDGGWKTFDKESDWRKAADEFQPLETAVVTRKIATVSIVYDVQGESGDWRNIDRYLFRADGTLIKLDRTFGSSSQDLKLTEEYGLDPGGKIVRRFRREVSLTTGKAKNEEPEKPQLPVVSHMNQLDFIKAP